MKAVIMAGGNGQRLRPITCTLPKPMVRVCGRPILDYVLRNLKKHSVYEATITARYLNDVIISHYANGHSMSMNISYSIEDAPLGTAGSVKKAVGNIDEDVLVISGDGLSSVDISGAYRLHKEKGADVTMVLHRVEEPLQYGVVITDNNGRVTKFCEKPSWCQVFSDTVNTGTYILSPNVIKMIPEKCQYDFSSDLFPEILKNTGKIYGYMDESYWCDIGNKEMYLQANKDVLMGKMEYCGGCTLMKNGIYYGKNVTVRPGAVIEDRVMLCDGCTVSRNARISSGSVIGHGAFIGEGASIKGSVIGDNVYIGECCEIRGGVICDGVHLGSNVRVFENAVIGDESRVGASATVNKGVNVWPRKTIDSGCSIDNDVVWDNTAKKDLLTGGRIRVKDNEDIHLWDVMKYAAAFSSLFNGEGSICVGMGEAENNCENTRENTRTAQSAYHSICAGVISQGGTCIKMPHTTLPVFRRFVREYSANGGIFIGQREGGCTVTFTDGNGATIPVAVQKRIWSKAGLLSSLPYHPGKCRIVEATGIMDIYENIISNEFSGIKDMGGCVRIFNNCSLTEQLLKRVLERLGFTACDTDNPLFTVSVDKLGEMVVLYGEDTKAISRERLGVLISVLKKNRARGEGIPDTEGVTQDYLRSISLEVARGLSVEGTDEERDINGMMYSYCGDSIYFILSLLSYMKDTKKTFKEMIEGLPNVYISEKTVKCPWNKKGHVMHEFYTRHNCSEESDMGIKINHDYGWSMIIPGEEQPTFKVISEGFSQEYADELCGIYTKKINQLLLEN
ncbi:MAG: hypothetical protein E7315_01720 [Clostridiales bacterium]|nr:hypothetical protein [Clostridiales bacterium]